MLGVRPVPLVKLIVDAPVAHAELVSDVLMELGAGAVEEQSTPAGARLLVYREDTQELEALAVAAREALDERGLTAGDVSLRVEVDAASDWRTAWMQYLKQERLTDTWVIQPEWDETPAPEGCRRLLFRPELAFGDGAHATTRLAARAVESFCAEHAGARVLDVGTGTGVLALVASLSGAAAVVGTDIDGAALVAAQANAELNAVDDVRFEDAARPLEGSFDLVVANIEPRGLLEAAVSIAAHARPARELVLTGFLSEQADDLVARFVELGFTELDRTEDDGWTLVRFRPRDAAPSD